MKGLSGLTADETALVDVERERRTIFDQRWVLALGYILASQLLFWPLLIGMELLSRPSGSAAPETISMSFLDREHPSFAQPVLLHRDAVPSYSISDPFPPEEAERVAYVHRFDNIESGEDMGLYMGWVRRIVAIEVNGTTVRQQTGMDHWGVLGGFEATAFVIPAEILETTDNELRVIGEGRSRKVAPAIYLSSPEDVLTAVSWGRLFDVELAIAAVAVMAIVLLIVLTAQWPPLDRYRMNGLAVLLAAWIFKNLAHLNIVEPTSDDWRMFFTFLVIFIFLAALCFFLLRWIRARRYLTGWLLAALSLLIAALAILNMTAEPIVFFRTAFWTETVFTSVICVVGMFALAWKAAGRNGFMAEFNAIETLLFLVSISVIGFDAIDDQFDVMLPFFDGLAFVNYKSPAFGIILGLGLCATLAAQATATRNLTRKANLELQRRVDRQSEKLEESYQRTRSLERDNATNDERQRILRDMHDGVGSLLLGLSMQIQSGRLGMDEVHDGIRKGITDLRLMVTAMDGVGDDLIFAIGAFVQRVRPDLEGAGIGLTVDINLPADGPVMSSRKILNLYRLLQECIANTIRHSGAEAVTIRVEPECSNPSLVRITVCDDGHGFDLDSHSAGRGIANIKQRARAMDSELEIRSDSQGTCITIKLSE